MRHRLRDLGLTIGVLPPGPINAITDVAGVRVGHCTVVSDEPGIIRTGVTAVIPCPGELWEWNLFAGFHRLNGFGEMCGALWIEESGLLTSPILLTSTYAVGVARDFLLAYPEAHGHPERFHEPVVAETNDGVLNDGLAAALTARHMAAALAEANAGPVAEGNVGGGTGMICHQFKGGIGTASRVVEAGGQSCTVGVLVQANHGQRRELRVDGVPVGRHIGFHEVPPPPALGGGASGSIITVVATDAPLIPVQCRRLAVRAGLGLARAGALGENGSGDLIVAFATGNRLPPRAEAAISRLRMLPQHCMDPLFAAAAEAAEEAVINALTAAVTMRGRGEAVAHALPLDRLQTIVRDAGWPRNVG